jgi:hypothetical protein
VVNLGRCGRCEVPSAALQGPRRQFTSEGGGGGGRREAGGVEESRRRKTRKGSHKSDEPHDMVTL